MSSDPGKTRPGRPDAEGLGQPSTPMAPATATATPPTHASSPGSPTHGSGSFGVPALTPPPFTPGASKLDVERNEPPAPVAPPPPSAWATPVPRLELGRAPPSARRTAGIAAAIPYERPRTSWSRRHGRKVIVLFIAGSLGLAAARRIQGFLARKQEEDQRARPTSSGHPDPLDMVGRPGPKAAPPGPVPKGDRAPAPAQRPREVK